MMGQDAMNQIPGWKHPPVGENLDRSNEIPGGVFFEQAEEREELPGVITIVVMVDLLDRGMELLEDPGIGE